MTEQTDGPPAADASTDGAKPAQAPTTQTSAPQEQNVVRRHTFFCVDRKRHTDRRIVIEAVPKTITVLGREVKGWIITTEQPVIDKTITLDEAMEGLGVRHDTE